MAAEQRRAAKPARAGLLRRAPVAGQALGAVIACGLWVGLASPSLQLLPGVGIADESIEISLQSALLGIEDAAGRPSAAEARAAAAVLGLSYGELLAMLPPDARPSSGIVRLDRAAAELATASRPQPDDGSAAASPAPSSQSDAPAAADPPPLSAEPVAEPISAAAQAPLARPATPKPEPVAAVPALLREQSVVFDTAPPAEAAVGGSYAVSATASSSLPVKVSVAGSRGACKLSGSTVSFRKTGTCVVTARQAGNDRYAPADAQQELEIGRAGQTVSFRSAAPSSALVGGVHAVSATASSGLPVALSASGACAVAGGSVSLVSAGVCRLDAVQVGDESWSPARAEQSFSVVDPPSIQLAQTIAFGSTPPAGAAYGGPAYAVSASASSGLPVSLSLAPSSAGVCALAGATVSLVGVGTCTIRANQAGSALYDPAPQAVQSFAVAKASQGVSFSSSAPGAAVFGDADYVVDAGSSSGLAVSLSLAPSSAGVCALAGSTVSIVGVGTCTVLADQTGDALYEAAPQGQQSFAVAKAWQSVSFTSSAPSAAVYGGTDYAVSAVAGSGLPVSLSLAPSSAGVCSLTGSTVSMIGVGTCTLRADQAGDGNHDAASQASQSFAVAKASQSIGFTSSAPSGAVFGGPHYSVSATATSGLPVSFSPAPSSAGVCSLAGSTVSLVGVGTCTIRADQAGNANHDAAPQVQQSFAVAKAPQTVGFTSPAPSGAVVGGPAHTVSATATSGLPVAFSPAPSSAGVCSVAGSTVSITGAGTCTILADQAGNANYDPASQAQQSFAVARSSQTIAFTSTPPLVDGSVWLYDVSATATSGLAVSFSTPSSGVCALFGSWVFFFGNGTCVVNANQGGNASWEPAPQAQQSILVTGH